MGSYASIMNDAPLNQFEVDLYVKFTTDFPGNITGLPLVTAAQGVVAALPIPDQNEGANVVLDQDSALSALGLDPGDLSLGPLLAATIGMTAIDEGYLSVPRGDVIRTDSLPINSTVYAQVLTVAVNNNFTVVLFAGTHNLTTAGTANGDNRFLLLEGILQGLDTRIVTPLNSTDPAATALIDQYEAMVQSEDTAAFTTKITPNVLPCAFKGIAELD
ncbi:hypothetical protein DFH08DRAFT_852137 [Mycena albidolilacea]|uniref:Uncharacterized protein n=1 Tax=Mycena albidolilacea TaxID=1033008 RepID=A0AAD7ACR1_9AGAR|nr:hypothetical protein DFH08DRAFT_852137 [Mycena albidolilacea]